MVPIQISWLWGRVDDSSDEAGRTRRTEGLRVQGRSARVVEQVLDAVTEELGRVGFGALRVEDVAARSGVNKTTIYRRWPTKVELVTAALVRVTEDPEVPDTGALRSDLLTLMNEIIARVATDKGRGVVRMIQVERALPEFEEVVRQLRKQHHDARRKLFDRAVERGELPKGTDTALLVELTIAPLMSRLVHVGVEADAQFVETLVDVIVAGARAGAAVRTRK